MKRRLEQVVLSVCKSFFFDSAHFLPYYEGKCRNLHGHRWELEVEVSGNLIEDGPETGMITDYARLGRMVDAYIMEPLDHKNLNDIGFINPTCEVIVNWCWGVLEPLFGMVGLRLERVRLYETPGNFAEVKESKP